jgi:hypothetical protein
VLPASGEKSTESAQSECETARAADAIQTRPGTRSTAALQSENLAFCPAVSRRPRIDFRDLSESERFEYMAAMIRKGLGPRAGRPRTDSDIPKWRDIGLTRQQVWRMRRLAEIPESDLDVFLQRHSANPKNRRTSYRSILIHFGKINVLTENDFDQTPLGELVRSLLAPCERLLDSEELCDMERRLLKKALQARLQQLFRCGDAR